MLAGACAASSTGLVGVAQRCSSTILDGLFVPLYTALHVCDVTTDDVLAVSTLLQCHVVLRLLRHSYTPRKVSDGHFPAGSRLNRLYFWERLQQHKGHIQCHPSHHCLSFDPGPHAHIHMTSAGRVPIAVANKTELSEAFLCSSDCQRGTCSPKPTTTSFLTHSLLTKQCKSIFDEETGENLLDWFPAE